jgi:hypothetical protein
MIPSSFVKICGNPSEKASIYNFVRGSRDSSFGIETGYGWRTGTRFEAKSRNFSFLHCVQIISGARQYPMSTGFSFPGAKQPRSETGHSISSNVEVKNYGVMSPFHSSLQSIVLKKS